MNKHEFRQLFNEKILILDGATGTNLMNAGMPLGVCPEKYILEHKKVMLELQTSYLNAGTDILYAPTFTCNRLKLREYGLETDLYQMNMDLVALSTQAVAECGPDEKEPAYAEMFSPDRVFKDRKRNAKMFSYAGANLYRVFGEDWYQIWKKTSRCPFPQ